MPISEAHVQTARASRYLVQLCKHVSGIYNENGPRSHRRRRHLGADPPDRSEEPPRVEWGETRGLISFSGGRITMRADPGSLVLRAEAADEESLQRAQDLVAGLLARFSRRDHLTVSWQRSELPT
jgi:hypothetical protein